MAVKSIDAKMLAKMFLAGAQNLENKKEWINELNVFPVPDGDTGTNMSLTYNNVVKETFGGYYCGWNVSYWIYFWMYCVSINISFYLLFKWIIFFFFLSFVF